MPAPTVSAEPLAAEADIPEIEVAVSDAQPDVAALPPPQQERSPYLAQWAEGDADPKYRRGRESVLFGPSDSPDRRLSTVYEQVSA